jgi:uncharacterized protein YoxC
MDIIDLILLAFTLGVLSHITIYITLNKIIMTQEELVLELQAVTEKVEKIGTETQGLIASVANLEAELEASGNISEDVAVALQALKDQAQVVDDLVEDSTQTT